MTFLRLRKKKIHLEVDFSDPFNLILLFLFFISQDNLGEFRCNRWSQQER